MKNGFRNRHRNIDSCEEELYALPSPFIKPIDDLVYEEDCFIAGRILIGDERTSNFGSFFRIGEDNYLCGKRLSSSGSIPVYIMNTPQNNYIVSKILFPGDFVEYEGKLTELEGENVFIAKGIRILSKARKNVYSDPEFNGYQGIDRKQKQVSVVSESLKVVRRVFEEKSFPEVISRSLRRGFQGGYVTPFVTTHRSGQCFYLQETAELDFKNLMVEGIEKVFSVSKSFRNLGKSKNSIPEFTLVEAYGAYKNPNYFHQIFFEIISEMNNIFDEEIPCDWEEKNFVEEFEDFFGVTYKKFCSSLEFDSPKEAYRKITRKYNLICKQVESPCILKSTPQIISPMTREIEKGIVDESLGIYDGSIIFTSLNAEVDPDKLARNFALQAEITDNNLESNQKLIEKINRGMPPSSGIGFGLERIIELYSDVSVMI